MIISQTLFHKTIISSRGNTWFKTMGGGVSRDDLAASAIWTPTEKLGLVGLMRIDGYWISWAPGGDIRSNETKLRSEETWLLSVQPETGLYTLRIGDGSSQRYLRALPDGTTDCNGQWSYHGALFWRIIQNADGSYSFKSAYDNYLTGMWPQIPRPRQVTARAKTIDKHEKFRFELVKRFNPVNYSLSVGIQF
jgi:hypothetical protein